MTGGWRFGPPTGAKGDGPARVVLETRGWAVRCYDAPTVSLDRSPTEWAVVANLGPDLSLASPDIDEVIARARRRSGTSSVSEMLLDQSVASGIGNVYRNEVLFDFGLHPLTPIDQVDDQLLGRVLHRASRHLRLNAGRRRTTTGSRRPGMNLYVYERAGKTVPTLRRPHPQGRSRRPDNLLVPPLPARGWLVAGGWWLVAGGWWLVASKRLPPIDQKI